MKKITRTFSFFFQFIILNAFAQEEYDSLKVLLQTPVHDTIKLEALSILAEISPEQEWQGYNQQMKLLAARNVQAQKAGTVLWKIYMFRLSEAYFNEGTDGVGKMQLPGALTCFRKSLAIDVMLGNTEGQAHSEVELAKIFTLQGNYQPAIGSLYKALKLYEKLDDARGMGNTSVNIGRIYMRQKKFSEAFEFFSKGHHFYKQAGYTKGVIDALDKLASVYVEQNKFDEALGYMHNITSITKAMRPETREPLLDIVYKVSGKICQLEGKQDSALYFFEKSLELSKARGLVIELSSRHRFVGSIYRDKKNYAQAIYHLREALKVSRSTHSLDEEYKASQALYQLYDLTHDYQAALRMHEFAVLMEDSIRRKEDESRIIQQRLEYEFDKKELIANANAEKHIYNLRLESERKNTRKNMWLLIMAVGLIVSASGSYFIYKYLRQKNVIAAQKANLLRQKLLVSQMNPHFIFNSLNAIQSYIFGQNSMQAGIYLSQFAQLMRMILDFSRKDYITLESEIGFLKLYMDLQGLRIAHKFDYVIETDEDEAPDLVLVPPMLAQPFIENAIEHGFFQRKGKGHLLVSIKKEGDFLRYLIEDNGIGLEATKKTKTEAASHESLAVKITRERLETLYHDHHVAATIDITDKGHGDHTNHGVRITFKIPYKELIFTYDQSPNH